MLTGCSATEVPGPADQHVGAGPDPHVALPVAPAISPRQRARRQIGGRCDDGPHDDPRPAGSRYRRRIVDGADIMLRRPAARRREGAIDRPRRAKDETKTASDVCRSALRPLTPCACAGDAIIKLPAARPSAQIAIAEFSEHCCQISCFQIPWAEAKTADDIAWFRRRTLWFNLPSVSPAVLSSTLRFVTVRGWPGRD